MHGSNPEPLMSALGQKAKWRSFSISPFILQFETLQVPPILTRREYKMALVRLSRTGIADEMREEYRRRVLRE